MTPTLTVDETSHTVGGVAAPVLVVVGELDAASADRLRDAVTGAVTGLGADGDGGRLPPPEQRPVLVLDLDDVSFCDSQGLSALLAVTQHAARRGVSLQLAVAPDTVLRRTIGRVGLDAALALHPTVADAAASRRPGAIEEEIGRSGPGT